MKADLVRKLGVPSVSLAHLKVVLENERINFDLGGNSSRGKSTKGTKRKLKSKVEGPNHPPSISQDRFSSSEQAGGSRNV